MSAAGVFKGLFSKADEALNALKREKGTGAEFLKELEKTPGVKPAEIKDRGLDKALPALGKTTKADVQRVLKRNPPPKIEETVRDNAATGGFRDIDGDLVNAEIPNPTRYGEYQIPGGQNYREILLRLPVKSGQETAPINSNLLSQMGLPQSVNGSNPVYRSSHWDEPNVLAHARVSDRIGPNGEKILHVEEIQSDWHQAGRKKGYQTPEQMAEIEAMKKAKTKAKSELKEIQRVYDEAKKNSQILDAKIASPVFNLLPPERQDRFRELAKIWGNVWLSKLPELMKTRTAYEALPDAAKMAGEMVPDAPFKKNWHELTMKRLLNYAAENDYDRIAITPGSTQAERYDLSKQIGSVTYTPDVNGGTLKATDLGNQNYIITETNVTPERLEAFIGKEAAQKLINAPLEGGSQTLAGEGLTVGGEGMKGFYDQILPTYLNNLGKPYGASVGQLPIRNPSSEPWGIPDAARFHGMSSAEYLGSPNRAQLEKQFLEGRGNTTTNLHIFDITPQMREEIKSKGLPLYSQIGVPGAEAAAGAGAGAGAATIGAQGLADNNEQSVQNPVQFTENPDVMRLELMQRD